MKMKMKNLLKATFAASVFLSGTAAANTMYLDLGANSYDAGRFVGAPDANTQTGTFTEFGFSQLLATSIYDLSDGSVAGSFYDTNIASELAYNNVPAAGTAMDGSTPVSLVAPDCANGQCDIDALSPLVPPLGTDNEGFLQTWDLQVEYHFDGTLGGSGPVYTGGTFDVYFNDFADINDRLVLTGTLTGSELQAANLNLFFDITFAEDNFLWVMDDSGSFVDANDGTISGNYATMVLDTNVNPPIPTSDQLLLVVDDGGNPNAIRQTTLDGSVTANIPEPSSLALLGLGLLGFGVARRKKA